MRPAAHEKLIVFVLPDIQLERPSAAKIVSSAVDLPHTLGVKRINLDNVDDPRLNLRWLREPLKHWRPKSRCFFGSLCKPLAAAVTADSISSSNVISSLSTIVARTFFFIATTPYIHDLTALLWI